jgi:hypothetical protein
MPAIDISATTPKVNHHRGRDAVLDLQIVVIVHSSYSKPRRLKNSGEQISVRTPGPRDEQLRADGCSVRGIGAT